MTKFEMEVASAERLRSIGFSDAEIQRYFAKAERRGKDVARLMADVVNNFLTAGPQRDDL